ncbi:hypothetical protein [Leptolyngbya sp. FACHB-261]|uniref:hypothetical protein n=1 Tax=Leptolyngbya sp. FACHB-261 TaxID=2692806 RepID=UPI001683E4FA|nr:hypothetical protein [Leptolyngbya sp. FACHB-261]MBD2102728.1 hypothetical protein [Leptolyngbya sp. FACHB-261]
MEVISLSALAFVVVGSALKLRTQTQHNSQQSISHYPACNLPQRASAPLRGRAAQFMAKGF